METNAIFDRYRAMPEPDRTAEFLDLMVRLSLLFGAANPDERVEYIASIEETLANKKDCVREDLQGGLARRRSVLKRALSYLIQTFLSLHHVNYR